MRASETTIPNERRRRGAKGALAAVTPAVARIRGLLTAELQLFWRNRTVVVNALLMPLVLAGVLAEAVRDIGGPGADELIATGTVGSVLLFTVYGNLVTTLVARRESLVLKRLRTGELTDGEIMIGVAGPSAVVSAAGIIAAVIVGGVLWQLPWPAHPLLLLLGLVGGIAVLAPLAALTTLLARTAEGAQYAALPVVLLSGLSSGMVVYLQESLPELATAMAALLPLSAVMEVVRLGWTGLGDAAGGGPLEAWQAAGGALAVVIVWAVVGILACRRWFRWEPRR